MPWTWRISSNSVSPESSQHPPKDSLEAEDEMQGSGLIQLYTHAIRGIGWNCIIHVFLGGLGGVFLCQVACTHKTQFVLNETECRFLALFFSSIGKQYIQSAAVSPNILPACMHACGINCCSEFLINIFFFPSLSSSIAQIKDEAFWLLKLQHKPEISCSTQLMLYSQSCFSWLYFVCLQRYILWSHSYCTSCELCEFKFCS